MSDAAHSELLVHAALFAGAAAAATLAGPATALLVSLRRRGGHPGLVAWLRRPSPLPPPLRLAAALVMPLLPVVRNLIPLAWRGWLEVALRRAGVDAQVQPCQWCLLPVPWLLAGAPIAAATPWPLAAFAVASILSVAAPWVWLRAAMRRREFAVLREMPLHLDLLALSLESGATLLLALRTSLPRTPEGPFRDALLGLLADLQTGRTRADGIRALQRRVDFECVRPLTTAMIQAERSGAGLAELLRVQSEQRSHERFHRAEQLAMQAPVKMLAPLVLCIFPGTFIVLAFVVFARVGG